MAGDLIREGEILHDHQKTFVPDFTFRHEDGTQVHAGDRRFLDAGVSGPRSRNAKAVSASIIF